MKVSQKLLKLTAFGKLILYLPLSTDSFRCENQTDAVLRLKAAIGSRQPPAKTNGIFYKSCYRPFVSFKQLAFLSRLIFIGPGFKYACFIFSNEDHVEVILSVHQQVPIIVRGRTVHIECAENCSYSLSPGSLRDTLELGKPFDPAT